MIASVMELSLLTTVNWWKLNNMPETMQDLHVSHVSSDVTLTSLIKNIRKKELISTSMFNGCGCTKRCIVFSLRLWCNVWMYHVACACWERGLQLHCPLQQEWQMDRQVYRTDINTPDVSVDVIASDHRVHCNFSSHSYFLVVGVVTVLM